VAGYLPSDLNVRPLDRWKVGAEDNFRIADKPGAILEYFRESRANLKIIVQRHNNPYACFHPARWVFNLIFLRAVAMYAALLCAHSRDSHSPV
jgi:hypothetical protein